VARLTLIDYGSGNLRSVQKAFEHVGARAELTTDPEEVLRAEALVLPGVGSFGHAMQELAARELVGPIRDRVRAGVPFLGVCLGLQLLFASSDESPGVEGLRLLPGTVVPDGSAFYFVHSYAVRPAAPGDVLTVTEYEEVTFVSGVERDNLTAFQFHPEKSSSLGLRIYENFARRVRGR